MTAALDTTPRRPARATTQTTPRATTRTPASDKPTGRPLATTTSTHPAQAKPTPVRAAAQAAHQAPTRPSPVALAPSHPVADTLGEQLVLAARRRQAAVAYVEGEERHTWPEVDQAADHLACGLLGLGLKRGDRMGVVALNQIEWLTLFYAAARIGVAVVALSPHDRDADLAHMLADSEARVVFTLRQHEGLDLVAQLSRLQPQLPKLRHVIQIGGEGLTSYASVAGTPIDITRLGLARRQVLPDDLAMVVYTPGLGGRPKGSALTHRKLLASASAQAAQLQISDADLLHMANPLDHAGGIACGALAHLVGGGSLVIAPEFRADRMLALMARHRPTLLSGSPALLVRLLAHASVGRVDFSQVRVVFTGGAPFETTLANRLAGLMPQAQWVGSAGQPDAAPRAGGQADEAITHRSERPAGLGQALPAATPRRGADEQGRLRAARALA